MEAQARMGRVGIAVGLILLLSGCETPLHQTQAFPATWPGTAPLPEEAPTVSVLPIAVDSPVALQIPDAEQGVPTAAVLSVLFIKHLHANGVNAILEPAQASTAQYVLHCRVPTLGYELGEHYPQTRRYRAELACTLRNGETQAVVWERKLAQQYDETDILDLLAKLPPQPHRHDRVLYRECIVPLWDAMSSSVGTVVTSRRQSAPNIPAAN